MSGDVQPKKRKDKKRRKDDGEQVPIQTHVPLLTTNVINDDINIHVHKESGTGGGICAKFVFFVLFSALAVLIGLIITEHRGLTDLDSVDTDSRYSQIFEGWVDRNAAHFDNHDVEQHIESQDEHEHEDEYDHEEEENMNDSEDEEHEQEIEPIKENRENANEDDEESKFSDEASNEEEQDNENDNDEHDYDNSVDESEERIVDEGEESDSIQASEEENVQDDRSYENDSEEKEVDDQEQDVDSDEENNEKGESDEGDDKDFGDLKYIDENYEEEEPLKTDDKDQNMQLEEKYVASIKERIETVQKEKRSPKKGSREVEEEQDSEDGYIQDSADVAVKLGVGVALLLVAYLVLVKKWRTAAEDKRSTESLEEPTPDLSRRNTIVVPPSFQEVEPDIEQDNEDYSEEDMSDYNRDMEPKSAKTKYQELSLKYSRSFTPDDDHDNIFNENDYETNIDNEGEESEDEEEEENEEDSKNEEYDEDEELLKRLEAKYGKLQDEKSHSKKTTTWKYINLPPNTNEETDSDRESDDSTGYENINITNKDDYHIKKDLDESQKHIENNSSYAIKLFDQILQKYPSSPRSLYGKALALDNLADQRRSNTLLNKALKLYIELLHTAKVPDALFEMAANRCIHRMSFIGQYNNLINIHNLVINKFPDNPKHLNDLAVTLLTINRVEDARKVLKKVLSKWPQNGFALVHYGFILKTTDNKLEEAVYYLKSGINTKEVGVHDGRFFFHLGDALSRLGRTDEAIEVYKKGAKNKVFLSTFQRSLYNVPRLTGKPWWDIEDLPFHTLFKTLKQYWKTIRDEGLSVLNQEGYFKDEAENLKDTGSWKQFELYARGQKNRRNCNKCPFTCSVIDKFPEARGCKRGQTKFSVMHPKTHVWPHSGPTNCRLRTHLGLKVPTNAYIRVVNETRSWKEGEIMVFDDSFEHEVWHNGTDFRLVLIVDVWHPELTPSEKSSISPI